MKIKYISEKQFYKDFLPLIIELECGEHYKESNPQHVKWLKERIHLLYTFHGNVIALYENNNPMVFLFLLHDKGLEGVRCFGKKATISILGLFEEYRSKGYGKNLLDEAENFTRRNGGECIYVNTYAKNSSAIRYYANNSFIPVAYHPNENGLNDKGQVYLCKELPKKS